MKHKIFNPIFLILFFIIIMRLFVLEPCQVSTSSMEPTLIGDPITGDKILINKCFFSMNRWDVVVFYYPLNTKKKFVKRLIGLPQEHVIIRNGNIFINGQIARKPFKIQQKLLYNLFSSNKDDIALFWTDFDEQWQINQNFATLPETSSIAWLTYYNGITNSYVPKQNGLWWKRSTPSYTVGGEENVGELELELDMIMKKQEGNFFIQIQENNYEFTLKLATPISSLTCYKNSVLWKTYEFSLTKQPKYHIIMKNIDLLLQVQINGKSCISVDYMQALSEIPLHTYHSVVQFGGNKSEFIVDNITLKRDIYYLGKDSLYADENEWDVPNNSYFVLGDNPPKSNDSRYWKNYNLSNRTTSEEETQENNEIQNSYFSQNIHQSSVETPFVQQDFMIGKALFIFWPLIHMNLIN